MGAITLVNCCLFIPCRLHYLLCSFLLVFDYEIFVTSTGSEGKRILAGFNRHSKQRVLLLSIVYLDHSSVTFTLSLSVSEKNLLLFA